MTTTFFENTPVPVGHTVLPNGFQILTANTGSKFVRVEVVVRTGGVDDKFHSGLAHLIEHLVCKDGVSRDRHPLIKALEDGDADCNAATTLTNTQYFVEGLASDTERYIEALVQVVFGRTFTNEAVDAERAVVLAECEQRSSDFINQRRYNSWIHAPDEPWTFLPIGLPERIQRQGEIYVNRRYQRDYRAGNAALIVTGGVSHAQVVEAVSTLSLPLDTQPKRALPPPAKLVTDQVEVQVSEATPEQIGVWWNLRPRSVESGSLQTALAMLFHPTYGVFFKKWRVEKGKIYSIRQMVSGQDSLCGIHFCLPQIYFTDALESLQASLQTCLEQYQSLEGVAGYVRETGLAYERKLERLAGKAAWEEWADLCLPDPDDHHFDIEELKKEFEHLLNSPRCTLRLRY